MNKLELKKFVEENPSLVSMKPAGDGIFVLKYKKKVFFDDLWNEYLEECRGTIVDADFNIVTYPFTKIYNYGIEKKAPVLDDDTDIVAFRKVNGFMVAVTWHDNKLLVSTTGSTDSDYVAMAREFINETRFAEVCSKFDRFTFMFECVHTNDPHIVPEDPGMYLLGYRFKDWGSEVQWFDISSLAASFGCFSPDEYEMTIGDLKELVKRVRHEGFVFYTEDGKSAKIKSPYYLTSKWVARNPRTDKIMREDFKKSIDEEYYPLVDAIRANITEYTAMDEQARLAWVRNQLA